jgi:hypothetical protein
MRKSLWIEVMEWCILVVVALFTLGVVVMRKDIVASAESTSTAPIESIGE